MRGYGTQLGIRVLQRLQQCWESGNTKAEQSLIRGTMNMTARIGNLVNQWLDSTRISDSAERHNRAGANSNGFILEGNHKGIKGTSITQIAKVACGISAHTVIGVGEIVE